jgi:hypothetical protein
MRAAFCFVFVALAGACSGPTFRAAPGAAGRAAGGQGAGGRAAAGAGTGDVGAGGADAGCDCGAAQYCRAGSCYDCSDFSSFEFGAAEEIFDYPSGGLRFPRSGPTPGELFFTLETDSQTALWYVAGPDRAPGPLGSASSTARSGLLYFEGRALDFDVLFDERMTNGRALRAATWDGALGNVTSAPPPFGATGGDEYSAALAVATGRVYFMTGASGAATLRTGLLGSAGSETVALAVRSPGGKSCAATGDDASPWITPDGALLAFSAPPVDDDCAPLDGAATDLYVAQMDKASGKPQGAAVPLAAVNVSTGSSSERDPSLSADLCALYFAADGGAARGFDFRLYRANRR